MSYIVIPGSSARQPQSAIRAAPYWVNRGLRFLFNPAVGPVNLVNGQYALQSGGFGTSVTQSGIAYAGATNYRAEFSPLGLESAGNSLTLFGLWRSKASAQYLGIDLVGVALSCRSAGNGGWGWARNGALGGGDTGNVTRQRFTLNGVADYDEGNYTIPSLVDAPVAFRAKGTAGSWFSNGVQSSADATLGTRYAGDNLVLGAPGPYSFNTLNWLDRLSLVAAFVVPLSDGEIRELSSNPWQLFAPSRRVVVFVGAAGTPTAVTATLAATDGADAAAFAATHAVPAVTAALAATDGADAAAFAATHTVPAVTAALAATDGADAAAFAGESSATPVTATLAATDGADSAAFAATHQISVTATLAATDGADIAAFAATHIASVTAVLAATDGADICAFAATHAQAIIATFAATEGADVATFTGRTAGTSIWTDVGVSTTTWNDVGGATSIWTDI